MTALPKRRISKARRRKRRTHDKVQAFHLVPCKECAAMHRSHHMCQSCGTYRGVRVFADTAD